MSWIDVGLGIVFLVGWWSMLAQSDVYNAVRHRGSIEHAMHVRVVEGATTYMFNIGLLLSLPVGIYFLIKSWKLWLLWLIGGQILYTLGMKRVTLMVWTRLFR